jgi:hypothetical protein
VTIFENPRWPPCKCLHDVYCIERGSSEFIDPENVSFAAKIKSLACLDAEILGKQVLNSASFENPRWPPCKS